MNRRWIEHGTEQEISVGRAIYHGDGHDTRCTLWPRQSDLHANGRSRRRRELKLTINHRLTADSHAHLTTSVDRCAHRDGLARLTNIRSALQAMHVDAPSMRR